MTERRQKQRFPIQLDVLYRVYERRTEIALGIGKTIDISSSGLVFQAQNEIPVGSRLEVSATWPALLHGNQSMRWVVFGNVVRSASGVTAVTIERCEYRTQSRSLPLPASPRINYSARTLALVVGRRTLIAV